MEQPLFKKPETPDFGNPETQKAYVEEAHSKLELVRKELDVNRVEQNLLQTRIRMMKDFINDLPSSDPQYSMLVAQVQMDLIEFDELKIRETMLIQRISNP
jgi:hypothetical protein